MAHVFFLSQVLFTGEQDPQVLEILHLGQTLTPNPEKAIHRLSAEDSQNLYVEPEKKFYGSRKTAPFICLSFYFPTFMTAHSFSALSRGFPDERFLLITR